MKKTYCLLTLLLFLITQSFSQNKHKSVTNDLPQNVVTDFARVVNYCWNYSNNTDAFKAALIPGLAHQGVSSPFEIERVVQDVGKNKSSRNLVLNALAQYAGTGKLIQLLIKMGLTANTANILASYVQNKEKEGQKEKINTALISYKSYIDDLLSKKSPLNEAEITTGPVSDFELIKDIVPKMSYNEEQLKYNLNIPELITLLDSVVTVENCQIKFDTNGQFKSLSVFNANAIKAEPIQLSNSIFNEFKKSISLVTPIVLNYDGKSYPVEFQTGFFQLYKRQVYLYKLTAFIPEKKSVRYLDSSKIDPTLSKGFRINKFDPSGPDYAMKIVTPKSSVEDYNYLKTLIDLGLKKKPNPYYDRDDEESSMITADIHNFADYFQIKNNKIVFNDLGNEYLITSRTLVTKVSLLTALKGQNVVLGNKIIEKLEANEEIYKTYFIEYPHVNGVGNRVNFLR